MTLRFWKKLSKAREEKIVKDTDEYFNVHIRCVMLRTKNLTGFREETFRLKKEDVIFLDGCDFLKFYPGTDLIEFDGDREQLLKIFKRHGIGE